MSDLRHQVAEALYLAFWHADPKVPTEAAVWMAATKKMESGKPIDEAWLSVADEAIRQMEWARRHCGEYFVVPGNMEPGKLVPLEEISLTLAPPEWKAE